MPLNSSARGGRASGCGLTEQVQGRRLNDLDWRSWLLQGSAQGTGDDGGIDRAQARGYQAADGGEQGQGPLLPHARGMPGPYTPIDGLRYQGDNSALVSHPGADFDGDGDDELLYNEYREVGYVGYLPGWPVPWDDAGWW